MVSLDLGGANLSFANLSDANLLFANLSDADLTSAVLFGANLAVADLSDANLLFANMATKHRIITGPTGRPEYRFQALEDLGIRVKKAGVPEEMRALEVTKDLLEQQVSSLEGATLPDGSKHQ
jgi:uncharacterized protein YjbI with pentapeptide repeats